MWFVVRTIIEKFILTNSVYIYIYNTILFTIIAKTFQTYKNLKVNFKVHIEIQRI